jgi:hypothetical protein
MNNRWLWVPAILALASTGCRRDPYMQVYIDNLNAEKRMLEDRVYELEYNYESKLCELEEARQQQPDKSQSGSSRLRDSKPPEPRRPSNGMPPGIPDLSPPSVDPGTLQGDEPAGDEEEGLGPLQLEMGEETEKINGEIPTIPDDVSVTHLYLHPALTGGDNMDDQPGDDGVSVAFEPRNQGNEFVPVPGRVSVVLLDPGNRSRVARWDFPPDDVALALQQARTGRGIRLRMPWQDGAPEASRLHMFVRYWTKEGNPVEADREISLNPASHLASRWTPRSQTRPRRAVNNVAENPKGTKQPQPAADATDSHPSAEGQVPKQAQLPQWRPYR